MKYYIILFLSLMNFGNAQNVFEKIQTKREIINELRINPNITEDILTYNLNESKDTLYLSSKYSIYNIDLEKVGYVKKYKTNIKEIGIDLKELPFGEYRVTINTEKTFVTFNLSIGDNCKKRKIFYWVIGRVESNFSSYEYKMFVSEEVSRELIIKNKKDLLTKCGINNSLIIWEVYDIELFNEYKKNNPLLIDIDEEIYFFNINPYYKN